MTIGLTSRTSKSQFLFVHQYSLLRFMLTMSWGREFRAGHQSRPLADDGTAVYFNTCSDNPDITPTTRSGVPGRRRRGTKFLIKRTTEVM